MPPLGDSSFLLTGDAADYTGESEGRLVGLLDGHNDQSLTDDDVAKLK